MKQFREDGARRCRIINPNPKGPDVEIWIRNHKECLFCEHCEKSLDLTPPKGNILARCQLPSLSPDGNCKMHNMNRQHTCAAFKDIEGDSEGVFMIKRKKPAQQKRNVDIQFDDNEQSIAQPMGTFSMGADGVKEDK